MNCKILKMVYIDFIVFSFFAFPDCEQCICVLIITERGLSDEFKI